MIFDLFNMSVKIRFQQTGKKNARAFRVVAVDESKKRDGSVIEILGFYNNLVKPAQFKLNRDRIHYWVTQGAQMSPSVKKWMDHK